MFLRCQGSPLTPSRVLRGNSDNEIRKSTCCLASRWKEYMAFLRSFYVADDIWRFAWSLVGCLLALSWLPPHTSHIAPPG